MSPCVHARRRAVPLWLLVLSVTVAAGCSSGSGAAQNAATGRPTSPGAGSASPSPTTTRVAPLHERTVWLCRPGSTPDPCVDDRTATLIGPDGRRRITTAPTSAAARHVDCFYVYPTVSAEAGANSDLRVQPQEVAAATAQAARFSQVCRIWAPMYRQRTTKDLFNLRDVAPNSAANIRAFASLLAGWRDYLRHDNHGRPIVFIGHSQGAAMLVRLLRQEVDGDPRLRRRTLLAILPGTNVETPTGATVGGTFAHLPLCTAKGERRCVIAYSTFPGQPPAGALFGRPGTGPSFLSGDMASAGRTVACVNPAAIGSAARVALHPYAPSSMVPAVSVTTPWVGFPGRVTGQCRTGGGASWLQIRPTGPASGLPVLREPLGPLWGYHTLDVTLPLGDLVSDVAAAARRVR